MELQPFTLRMSARKALAGHWLKSLFAAFGTGIFATVTGLIASGEILVWQNAIIRYVEQGYDAEYILTQLPFLYSPLTIVMLVLAFLVGPSLQMGLKHYCLLRLDGQDPPFTTIFSRMRVFFKAIGLEIVIGIKLILWVMVVNGPVLGLAWLLRNSAIGAINFLLSIAPLAGVILAIIAFYRYQLAYFAMAEDPSLPIFKSIKLSKTWMKGYKGKLFITQLSFIGWTLLVAIVYTILTELLGGTVALAFNMFAQLALNLYMLMTCAAFYKARIKLETVAEVTQSEE